MSFINVKIINQSSNQLPEYGTPGAAGLDLRANLEAPVTLQPMERALIPTGLFIELPDGYEAQVRPRSGLAIKQGLTCLNTPGTIDSDYRGEIKVILINLSQEPQTIQHADRIAQMVVAAYTKVQWESAVNISSTQRADGGFGHTGKS